MIQQRAGIVGPSDEELMGRVAGGDQVALQDLHARYAPLVYGLAARTLDPAAAEEIVQDVFLAIWRGAATFDPSRGTFRAWALRIAHLRVLNELRRRRRRPTTTPDPDGRHVGTLPDVSAPPDEAAWLDYRRLVVREAVQALPPLQRQALSLAFFDDLTHEQVAEFLNLPLGTAKTRIRAGVRKLRLQLAPLVLTALLAALLGGLVYLGVRFERQRAALDLQQQALRVATSSEAPPLRLSAVSGVPPTTHATYRGRTGVDLGVMNFSDFAPPPSGHVYQAWIRHGTVWTSLGTVRPDASGEAMLIARGAVYATPPDALEVTREPAPGSAVPTGPVVVLWSGP
ncbi:MAG TPA: sigma-70 family RNA polymerase sigma factor [Thermomicrobiaceae bacterium]|nr:sigma-70 family RNA polymerase sigma factor [Thermomicrobiaceae bacterium]